MSEYDNKSAEKKYEFVEKVPNKFMCHICNYIMVDAVGIPCGHEFCEKCIIKHNLPCPICEENFDCGKIAAAYYRRNQINKLKVYCPNKIYGCPEIYPFDEIAAHKEMCDIYLFNALKDEENRLCFALSKLGDMMSNKTDFKDIKEYKNTNDYEIQQQLIILYLGKYNHTNFNFNQWFKCSCKK